MKKIATMIAAVTEAQARQIALQQAGAPESSVNYMRVKEDWDDGRREYDVKFYVGRTEYNVDVDIETGRVMDFDIDFD